jgi:chitinase
LLQAYLTVLDVVGTTHLDLDVETGIDFNMMNSAMAAIQAQRPNVTVSYTLMIQAEDYGIIPSLGVEVLKDAKSQGVRVDIVNGNGFNLVSQTICNSKC